MLRAPDTNYCINGVLFFKSLLFFDIVVTRLIFACLLLIIEEKRT